ncbi:hypothetical protein BpHYR1_048195 [Brachionus plicatilis]|uniref:Uncharacterized protein n=1 Tax=Brachionus plicatilis TaxID=10195 RepID=A0A3M7QY02_BRAPC|nr:hypothetical protein BpHYR1_048195 [Brachionus plicatilis]
MQHFFISNKNYSIFFTCNKRGFCLLSLCA